ncbi:hypothetical protein GCM10017673_28780 [Streptosporangium violaceochromogenes]|nr:hypothetical protein GCM10017673_28780 [Streptosporangium violaceochromogenes]
MSVFMPDFRVQFPGPIERGRTRRKRVRFRRSRERETAEPPRPVRHAPAPGSRTPSQPPPRRPGLRTVVECPPCRAGAEVRHDQPLGFAEGDRRFASRTVLTGEVPLTDDMISTGKASCS